MEEDAPTAPALAHPKDKLMQVGLVQGLAVKRVEGRAALRDVHRVETGLQLLAL